jgi:hypothetical protein
MIIVDYYWNLHFEPGMVQYLYKLSTFSGHVLVNTSELPIPMMCDGSISDPTRFVINHKWVPGETCRLRWVDYNMYMEPEQRLMMFAVNGPIGVVTSFLEQDVAMRLTIAWAGTPEDLRPK